uniref:Cupin type-1 domain-containing protein n=1 Tax=Lactuca sativa TaxID=4236 RepID=A0A9R1VU81_LACSA|nr:hypothetical protein LSAT_V11C400199370 [Lactuca sativa]
MCTVRLVAPNSSEEIVIVIKKGDVGPLPSGVVSWCFNGSETDATIMFIGETTIAHVPGILHRFQSDVVAKVFSLSNKEAGDIVTSQRAAVIDKLKSKQTLILSIHSRFEFSNLVPAH